MRTCCIAQGTLHNALWGPKWEGNPKKRGYMFMHMDFPSGSDGKESACNAEDLGLITGWGRSPGEGNSNPHQYSCRHPPPQKKGFKEIFRLPWWLRW